MFSNLKYSFELKTNMRQRGDIVYQQILQRIHDKQSTDDDINILSSRLVENVTQSELKSFWTSIHLFSTNAEVNSWNEYFLSHSDYSVRPIRPISDPECILCASEFSSSFLGKNVPIILQRNLFVSKNICNGSLGIVKDLYYSDNYQPLPDFITVIIDRYSGKKIEEDLSLPLTPLKETIFCSHLDRKIKVIYYPIKNSHARTFYRIQSVTLDKIAVSLEGVSYNDHASIYTAFSRCVSLNGLLVQSRRPLKNFFQFQK